MSLIRVVITMREGGGLSVEAEVPPEVVKAILTEARDAVVVDLATRTRGGRTARATLQMPGVRGFNGG